MTSADIYTTATNDVQVAASWVAIRSLGDCSTEEIWMRICLFDDADWAHARRLAPLLPAGLSEEELA